MIVPRTYLNFVPVFAALWNRQRRKAHGAGKAPFFQALLFSWAGAWMASHFGPNPMDIHVRLGQWRHKNWGESDMKCVRIVRGWMCAIDATHELGHATGGTKVYASLGDLKACHPMWAECGVTKVEVLIGPELAPEKLNAL